MYAHRPSAQRAAPLENRALLNAVRHISSSLVRRAGAQPGRSPYATLLAHIWGQSRYATVDDLVRSRALRAADEAAGTRLKAADAADPAASARRKKVDTPLRPRKGTADPDADSDADPDAVPRRDKQRDAARDRLVALLRTVKDDELSINECKLTATIVNRDAALDIDALRRLWGVPRVIFEAADLEPFLRAAQTPHVVLQFYHTHIIHASPDARIFNILYWKENRHRHHPHRYPPNPKLRTISKRIIARVVNLLLTKRRSPFYEKNMHVVVETVLYAIHPDRFVQSFCESALRKAAFFQGLQGYEYSRSFTASLENLHLGKLNRMLKDIRAVRAIAATDPSSHPCHIPDNQQNHNNHNNNQDNLSLTAISKYCAERDTLTDRALRAVHDRYVPHRRPCHVSLKKAHPPTMAVADFVRMYLALVGCGTDPGLSYWFSILDHDGDGWVSLTDVAHFYAERKVESEKRNGIILADLQSLWIRLCAMLAVSPNGRGLTLNSLRELGREEREFVMCALLVRRADDGNLINIAATVSSNPATARALK